MVVAACKGEVVSSCQERLEAALVLPPASHSCPPPTACPHRDLTGEVCNKTSYHMQPCIAPIERGWGQPVSLPPVHASLVRVSQASQALCAATAALRKALCAALVRIKGGLWVISDPVSDHWMGEEVIRLASLTCSYIEESNGVVLLPTIEKLYLLGVTHCIWVTDDTWEKLSLLPAESWKSSAICPYDSGSWLLMIASPGEHSLPFISSRENLLKSDLLLLQVTS